MVRGPLGGAPQLVEKLTFAVVVAPSLYGKASVRAMRDVGGREVGLDLVRQDI
jgi:hypothetical protein